jgi:hypothetical protein
VIRVADAHARTAAVGSPLKVKAPSSAQDSLNLVRATLEDWNANPDHSFDGHSDPLDTVRANFAAEVVPK